MSGKLVKTSMYVVPYTNAEKHIRRMVRNRIKKYLSDYRVSQDTLAEQFTELLEVNYTRKTASGLVEFLGYPKKDKEMVAKAKREAGTVFANTRSKDKVKLLLRKMKELKLDKDKFSIIWSTLSFNEIQSKYGLSQYDSSLIAEHYSLGIKPNKQYDFTYKDLYEELEKHNITLERIKKDYLIDLVPITEIRRKYSEAINREVSEKRFDKMLKYLNIERTSEQLYFQKGRKSRRIKADNLARLALSGYTLSTLANKYEEDLTLTKRALLKEINAPLEGTVGDEFKFTDRWLARHIDPLLTKVRLGSVSRSELEFTKVLQESLNGEELRTSVRDLIPPQEVDLYFPELKLAIEFNGDYWHSDKFMEDNHQCSAKVYHEDKVNRCAALGVKLIFVWESDWVDHDEVVLSAIKDLIYNKKDSPIINKLESPFDLE